MHEKFLETLRQSDPEFHWEFFPDFIRKKLDVGEPSPHMKIVGHLSQDCSWEEKIWRAGCYAAPYSVISAEVLWTYWPLERMLAHTDEFLPWLQEHWGGIHWRMERRCVNTPAKFAENLTQYAEWAVSRLPQTLETRSQDKRIFYDQLWESVTSVKFMGRYISIRLIELMRRFCNIDAPLYDIRSIGGWSPKQALTLLRPDRTDEILSDNMKVSNAASDEVAEEIFQEVRKRNLLELDYYIFAAMLCEYREAYEDRHQYPGRTHDQEISYHSKFSGYWKAKGFTSRLFEARAAIFPHECLGELNGWDGIRHELSRVLRDEGYNWSDLIYDYAAFKEFPEPVLR